MKQVLLLVVLLKLLAPAVVFAVPEITEEEMEMAMEPMRLYGEVIDVAIKQNGRKVELTILVIGRTRDWAARELGESFIRILKNVSQDIAPDKRIGTGIYHYTVRIVYPDEVDLAVGKKFGPQSKMYWLKVKDPNKHLKDFQGRETDPETEGR
jgi:hypothetical protein